MERLSSSSDARLSSMLTKVVFTFIKAARAFDMHSWGRIRISVISRGTKKVPAAGVQGC